MGVKFSLLNMENKTDLSFVKAELVKVGDMGRELQTAEQIKFAKDLTNPDLTNPELFMFLAFANKLQLNPFTKEIVALVFNKDKPAERRVNFIVTKDGKLVVARRTSADTKMDVEAIYIAQRKNENQETVTNKVAEWEGGILWGAKATVIRDGREYKVTVPLTEYDTGRNAWVGKKSTMIKKVALSQALTMAFPEILGGIYDDSEMALDKDSVPSIVGGDEPATPQQLETLEKMGKEIPEGITKQEALKMLVSKGGQNGK